MMLKCNKTSKIIYCIIYCYRYTLIFSKSAFRLKNDGDNFPFNPSAAKENQKKKRERERKCLVVYIKFNLVKSYLQVCILKGNLATVNQSAKVLAVCLYICIYKNT